MHFVYLHVISYAICKVCQYCLISWHFLVAIWHIMELIVHHHIPVIMSRRFLNSLLLFPSFKSGNVKWATNFSWTPPGGDRRIKAHPWFANFYKPAVTLFSCYLRWHTKQKLKGVIKYFWSNPSLLKTQFHNLKAPLHTRFTGVKTFGSVNTSWGGTFRVKLVNLQAFSAADNIWAHIKSVRSDGCGTSSAFSHW